MIDFIIIGAQKAGTTALYEYLKTHPEINLPINKEAAYFLQDLPWQEFYNENYVDKKGNRKTGSISPHYMCGRSAAGRIRKESPDSKFVALLRDPLTRAYSHYQMNLRRNHVQSGFNEEVQRCVTLRGNGKIESDCEADAILLWGEYGRILKPFYDCFPKEQILLLDFLDFKRNPKSVFNSICCHLGISSQWVPANLGKPYHVGGRRTVLPSLKFWSERKMIKAFWKLFFSQKMKSRLKFWYEINNVKKNQEETEFSTKIKQCFLNYYKADLGNVAEVDKFYKKWFKDWAKDCQPAECIHQKQDAK